MDDNPIMQSPEKGTAFFRQCRACKEHKSLKEFQTTIISPRSGAPLHRHVCHICAKKARTQRTDASRDSIENYATLMVRWSKDRAKMKSSTFALSEGWIVAQWDKQNGKCYYSGEPMELMSGPRLVTVERLNVSRGYEPDNCVLACLCINMMRGRTPVEEFMWWCKKVTKNATIKATAPK